MKKELSPEYVKVKKDLDAVRRRLNAVLAEVMPDGALGWMADLPPMEGWERRAVTLPQDAIIPELEFVNDRRFMRLDIASLVHQVSMRLDEVQLRIDLGEL